MSEPKPTEFKKRPVAITAMQFTGKNGKAVVEWIKSLGGKVRNGGSYLKIETLEGPMTAHKGSMIVCGIAGEFYPVQKDIFIKTYSIPKSFAFAV